MVWIYIQYMYICMSICVYDNSSHYLCIRICKYLICTWYACNIKHVLIQAMKTIVVMTGSNTLGGSIINNRWKYDCIIQELWWCGLFSLNHCVWKRYKPLCRRLHIVSYHKSNYKKKIHFLLVYCWSLWSICVSMYVHNIVVIGLSILTECTKFR